MAYNFQTFGLKGKTPTTSLATPDWDTLRRKSELAKTGSNLLNLESASKTTETPAIQTAVENYSTENTPAMNYPNLGLAGPTARSKQATDELLGLTGAGPVANTTDASSIPGAKEAAVAPAIARAQQLDAQGNFANVVQFALGDPKGLLNTATKNQNTSVLGDVLSTISSRSPGSIVRSLLMPSKDELEQNYRDLLTLEQNEGPEADQLATNTAEAWVADQPAFGETGNPYESLSPGGAEAGSMSYEGARSFDAAAGYEGGWGGAGGGGACCFIFIASHGFLHPIVRRYRDAHMTPRNRRGYYWLSDRLLPLMKKSKTASWLVKWLMVRPMTSYGEYFYNLGRIGVVFAPVTQFWLTVFTLLGMRPPYTRKGTKEVV